jgi:hypothetical protein
MSAPRHPRASSSVRRSRGGGTQWQSCAQGALLLETRWWRRPAGPACRNARSSTWRWRTPRGRARSLCASAQATRASSSPRRRSQPSKTSASCVTPLPSTARVSFWTTAPTATGAPPCGGSAVTMHPPVPPWRLWRRPSTSTSRRQPRTRADYWWAWRLVVTWAVARQAVHDILPMLLDTLKALTWDMVCLAVPSSQIELVWESRRSGASPAVSAPPAAL